MDHQNARGQQIPNYLWRVAVRVRSLVRKPSVMKWWRAQVAQWCQGADEGRKPDEYAPLPVELTVYEQCAVLAAIHDVAVQQGMELIGPHEVGDGPDAYKDPRALPVVRFAVLKVAVSGYSEREARRLLGVLKKTRDRVVPPLHFLSRLSLCDLGPPEF